MKFEHVLIDEAQDLSMAQMTAIMRLYTKDMMVAMDMNQKIHSRHWTPKLLGIESTTKKLTKSMRTTKQIEALAESLRCRNDVNLSDDDKSLRASLTDKLITLTSDTNASKLKRNLHVPGRVKAENKQIFYIVDAINEAINSGKRISFQYIDYNSWKKEVLRNKGKACTVSPYSLIWNGDYYYLVGYYHEKEDIRTFRVDRIKQQPEVLETAADPVPEDFDITRYTREVFRMYDTEEAIPVTLVCENEVMKGVLDAFGMDIKVKRAEKGHFQTTVMACTSPTFYGWVFQWGGKVKITAPEEAVLEYKKMAEQAIGD